MPWLSHLPHLMLIFWAFILGVGVGSFLHVLVVRLPYEKSIVWPSSRCFICFNKINLFDNLPLIGFLRLRGRCRKCKAPFSWKYLWVELLTGLLFVLLYCVDVMTNAHSGPEFLKPWHTTPGLSYSYFAFDKLVPNLLALFYFACHACVFSLLLAAALIDLKFKFIPTHITYIGTVIGLLCSTMLPWPWPNPVAFTAALPLDTSWAEMNFDIRIVNGVAPWPFWGPLPSWAPAGSPQCGFLTGLLGALAGMLIGRSIKGLFEVGMGKEALGLGDADLLMMAGSFLGWQVISLAFPVGAVITLFCIIPIAVITKLRGKKFDPALPFGPGLAAGILTCWLGWPWLGELVRVAYFDFITLSILLGLVGGGLFVFGFLLRRPTAA